MPRKARIDAPGALHHIIVRGIERKKIFYNDSDRDDFVARLGNILSETQTACFAWVLIPNHFHLLLRTSLTPIATVMQRLLTGYAISFNRRHRRHGHVFQNRYKSILCQEDTYFLQLVRYIHLNPLRAKLVADLKALEKYPYSGHVALMGKKTYRWQDTDYVLNCFSNKLSTAKRRYNEFVREGISEGRRDDLTGGGLLRSAGGWVVLKSLRRTASRIKGDERILGDGDFVETVLKAAQEQLDRTSRLDVDQYDIQWLIERVSKLLDISKDDLVCGGKYPITVEARSVVCFWGKRELGISTVELAKKLNISQSTASQSVVRGQKIVHERKLDLFDQGNQ